MNSNCSQMPISNSNNNIETYPQFDSTVSAISSSITGGSGSGGSDIMSAASVVSSFGGQHYASSVYEEDINKCEPSKKYLLDLDENNEHNRYAGRNHHQISQHNILNSNLHDLASDYSDLQKKNHSIKRQKILKDESDLESLTCGANSNETLVLSSNVNSIKLEADIQRNSGHQGGGGSSGFYHGHLNSLGASPSSQNSPLNHNHHHLHQMNASTSSSASSSSSSSSSTPYPFQPLTELQTFSFMDHNHHNHSPILKKSPSLDALNTMQQLSRRDTNDGETDHYHHNHQHQHHQLNHNNNEDDIENYCSKVLNNNRKNNRKDPILEFDTELAESIEFELGLKKQNGPRKNSWGNLSYAELITRAIESSCDQRLTLSQIYDWIVRYVPYFKEKFDRTSSAGWKVCIFLFQCVRKNRKNKNFDPEKSFCYTNNSSLLREF
jgi:hypothetical protein